MKKDESFPQSPEHDEVNSPSPVDAPTLTFSTLYGRPTILSDIFRALLVVLSIVVIIGLALILLPQTTVDKMTLFLQSRQAAAQQVRIALLYLGDEIGNNDFKVRGVVRNIASTPIEKLDASIRFVAHDGSILATNVVRMSKETIDPGEIALFELVYPNYGMEFRSYSVEFKLRQGGVMPYKDLRSTQTQK